MKMEAAKADLASEANIVTKRISLAAPVLSTCGAVKTPPAFGELLSISAGLVSSAEICHGAHDGEKPSLSPVKLPQYWKHTFCFQFSSTVIPFPNAALHQFHSLLTAFKNIVSMAANSARVAFPPGSKRTPGLPLTIFALNSRPTASLA